MEASIQEQMDDNEEKGLTDNNRVDLAATTVQKITDKTAHGADKMIHVGGLKDIETAMLMLQAPILHRRE